MRTLKEAMANYDFRVFAFCAMPTHWHLLVTAEKPKNLIRGMQWLGATHAIRLRRCHETVGRGAIYQGRYRSHWIKPGSLFWVITRYIERNPVRAGLVSNPLEWEWSSYGQKGLSSVPLTEPPVDKPKAWDDLVHAGGSAQEERQTIETILRLPLSKAEN
jgi:putative transposase